MGYPLQPTVILDHVQRGHVTRQDQASSPAHLVQLDAGDEPQAADLRHVLVSLERRAQPRAQPLPTLRHTLQMALP